MEMNEKQFRLLEPLILRLLTFLSKIFDNFKNVYFNTPKNAIILREIPSENISMIDL